jgi:hypothetical protein
MFQALRCFQPEPNRLSAEGKNEMKDMARSRSNFRVCPKIAAKPASFPRVGLSTQLWIIRLL